MNTTSPSLWSASSSRLHGRSLLIQSLDYASRRARATRPNSGTFRTTSSPIREIDPCTAEQCMSIFAILNTTLLASAHPQRPHIYKEPQQARPWDRIVLPSLSLFSTTWDLVWKKDSNWSRWGKTYLKTIAQQRDYLYNRCYTYSNAPQWLYKATFRWSSRLLQSLTSLHTTLFETLWGRPSTFLHLILQGSFGLNENV